jgi:hypothetical protein
MTAVSNAMIAAGVAILFKRRVTCDDAGELVREILHAGFKLAGDGRVRSPQDHRRFFGVIRAAFLHWPEQHEFQPDDAEHLRAWLLCKAGYKRVTHIPFEASWPDAMQRLAVLSAEAALKAAKSHAFLRPDPTGFLVFAPKSIDWETLGQKEFSKVREAVEEVIAAETGKSANDLLKETERAA